MGKLVYIAGVSGTGKTSVVEQYEGKDRFIAVFFSKRMKEYAMEHKIIENPENVYTLPSDIRDEIEKHVRKRILSTKEHREETIIIDGHLYVESEAGGIRMTFADDIASNFDLLIFIILPIESIIANRNKRGAFRPQSIDPEKLCAFQKMSYERAIFLSEKYNIKLVTIDNSDNELTKTLSMISTEVGNITK